MLDVSGRWESAIRSAGVRVARAEVWRSGARVMLNGAPLVLKLSDGSVRVDEGSNVRRTLTASIGDTGLMPDDATDVLSPTDTDLRVFAGVQYLEGDSELVPVGVFRLSSIARPSLRSPEVTLDARDYAQVLMDARFESPYNVPKSTPLIPFMAGMVTSVLPWVEVVDLTGSRRVTSASGGAFPRDRWESLQQCADAIGADAAFDPEGRFVIRPAATIAAEPDYTIDYGLAQAVTMDTGVSVSADGVWNSVTAAGSGDAAVSARVRRTTGPFRWRTGFQHPRFFASPILRTTAQCVQSAASILARSGALTEEITPTCAPNWALDVGDTAGVQLPGRGLVLRIVSGMTLPLGPGSMSVTTRTVAEGVDDIEGLD